MKSGTLFTFAAALTLTSFLARAQDETDHTVQSVQTTDQRVRTLSLRADYWCPYNCAPDTEKPGVLIELARHALKDTDHQLDYQLLNWARAKLTLKTQPDFALVGLGWTPDTASEYQYTQPLMRESPWCLYTLTSNPWEYQGPESFGPRILGVPNDYQFDDPIDQHISQGLDSGRVYAAAGDKPIERLMVMLNNSRVDVILDERHIVRYAAAKMEVPVQEAGCLKDPVKDERARGVYIGFSWQDPDAGFWIERLNQALNDAIRSGYYAELLQRYGLDPGTLPPLFSEEAAGRD